jgi:hypothetical protein
MAVTDMGRVCWDGRCKESDFLSSSFHERGREIGRVNQVLVVQGGGTEWGNGALRFVKARGEGKEHEVVAW